MGKVAGKYEEYEKKRKDERKLRKQIQRQRRLLA